MNESKYQYRLVISKERGLVPINEINEGEEVMCFGEWKHSPKPVQGTCLKCKFDLLPTTSFEKSCATHKREISINHSIPLKPTTEYHFELSIRGFFKEDKVTDQGVFKNWEDLPYWLPRMIKYYNQPLLPVASKIGWNVYNIADKKIEELKGEELTERNLEYILEGMNRHTFSYAAGRYGILPYGLWNETHKIVLRLLDIECEIQTNRTVVKNPINFYRHIKDDYTKALIKDEDIVYNLRRSTELPPYTNGYVIKEKEEVTDWILPGINPDINGLNPRNCYEEGFTMYSKISPTKYVTRNYKTLDKPVIAINPNGVYITDNLYKLSGGSVID